MYGLLLVALAVLVILGLLARWGFSRTAILTLEDAICSPDEEPVLTAWLERKLFLFVDPNIEGEEIEFLRGDEVIGRGRTNLDGKVRIGGGPFPPGLHPVRVRLAERSRYRAPDAEGLAAVLDPAEPALVTDIDQTVADCSPLGFLTRPGDRIRPLPGAPEALTEIGRAMRIVYLSARDHIFLAKTRRWLRRNGFPEGPLFLRRLRFTQASPLEHKLQRLEEILAKLQNVRYGVGDRRHDVEAYRKRGIRPILLTRRPPSWPIGDLIVAESWEDILSRVRPVPHPEEQ